MESEEVDKNPPGTVYWAKVGSHPWWPCMVYNSPNGDGHVKVLKSCPKYHVQFFGPVVERAWVSSVNLIPYKTKEAFESQLEDLRRLWPVCVVYAV